MARGRPTGTLQHLSGDERATVLGALLDAHPDLRDEADRLAAALLADIDRQSVASSLAEAYLNQSYLDIGSRAGRQLHGGYVHEVDAQWELLEEALEPFEHAIVRLARLGMTDAAHEQAAGILMGLYRLRETANQKTLIGWGALEDHTWGLAQGVVATCQKAGLKLSVDNITPEWQGIV